MAEMQTTQMHQWVRQLRDGDPKASNDLLLAADDRLRILASRMLSRYPKVARLVDTSDIYQSAAIRLLRALETVLPGSMREFYGLAAEQMRRELLDMVRHYYGPHGDGRNQANNAEELTMRAPSEAASDMEIWTAFHEGVVRLPTEERETVNLVFYHGWTQTQVAEAMGVSERTVQRWWKSAMQGLKAGEGERG